MSGPANDPPFPNPIVFIHGLWLHRESWKPWIEFFREHAIEATAASWPGEADTLDGTRRSPGALAGYGVGEVAEYIAEQIQGIEPRPILIGHSFGGLLVQKLLGRGLGAAGIAIDPAPIKGVYQLPVSALRASLPVLRNPLNYRRSVALTPGEFRYAFANAVSEEEAGNLYEDHVMPAPGRPLFQAATATLNPWSATRVAVDNPDRGPLLLVAGSEDHIVPTVLVRSAQRRYGKSPAVTDFVEFPNRGHSIVLDSGWREVATYCLGWLTERMA